MSVNHRSTPDEVGPSEDVSGLEETVWANLDEIPDPHIPVSLVEMAMIYGVDIEQGMDGVTVYVEMTYPCMGCPAYDMIQNDIRACLLTMDEVRDVEIDVVWDPIWEKRMLTSDVREKLHESGIAL